MNLQLSHIDASGRVQMVDISSKAQTDRSASAKAIVRFPVAAAQQLRSKGVAKGEWQATAKIAGIQAAKQTQLLIPLCHPLKLSCIEIDIQWLDNSQLSILSTCKCQGTTGVEMEALTAVSIAALTVYDMCKALSKDIEIAQITLVEKTGGKTDYHSVDN